MLLSSPGVARTLRWRNLSGRFASRTSLANFNVLKQQFAKFEALKLKFSGTRVIVPQESEESIDNEMGRLNRMARIIERYNENSEWSKIEVPEHRLRGIGTDN